MRIVKTSKQLQRIIQRVKKKGQSIGFVPTMGALHEGHLSLIRQAKRDTDCVVVSIFVNPIQFNRKSDLSSYPKTLLYDAHLSSQAGVDLLFVPKASEIYPPGFQTFVEVERLSQPLEGRFRPGHFRGVTTVVASLFHLVQPDVAYFGQKDAQQARIVQQMVRDLHFDIRLKILPTVREPDGLAMSSRNRLLSLEARRSSRVLFNALQEARRLIKWGERRGDLISRRMRQKIKQMPKARCEYAVVVDPETFESVEIIQKKVWLLIAVWIGSVRLIDQLTVVPS